MHTNPYLRICFCETCPKTLDARSGPRKLTLSMGLLMRQMAMRQVSSPDDRGALSRGVCSRAVVKTISPGEGGWDVGKRGCTGS